MNEILNHYQLFGVVFITLLLMVFLVYTFLFQREKEENSTECLAPACTKEDQLFNPIEYDKEIFQKFKKLLPPVAGSIFFLRNNDMTVVFHKRGLDGLYAFYEGCKNGEYIFKDEELDELKKDLYFSIEKYLLTLDTNSKETSSGYYKVQYNIDGLHILVDELLKKYDKLISLAQKKLLLV